MKLPELCEGWTWRLSRSVEVVEIKGEDVHHPKVHIELLFGNEARRRATIDVTMYGDTAAVRERAEAMVRSMAAEQLEGLQ